MKNNKNHIEKITELRKEAELLLDDESFIKVCNEALKDKTTLELARKDPRAFFKSKDQSLPENLTVQFFDNDTRIKPRPEFSPVVFEQFNCRTIAYWEFNTQSRRWEIVQEEICTGFRLIPVEVWPPELGPWVQPGDMPWFEF